MQSVGKRGDVVDDGFRFGVVRGDTGNILELLDCCNLFSIRLVLVNFW